LPHPTCNIYPIGVERGARARVRGRAGFLDLYRKGIWGLVCTA